MTCSQKGYILKKKKKKGLIVIRLLFEVHSFKTTNRKRRPGKFTKKNLCRKKMNLKILSFLILLFLMILSQRWSEDDYDSNSSSCPSQPLPFNIPKHEYWAHIATALEDLISQEIPSQEYDVCNFVSQHFL